MGLPVRVPLLVLHRPQPVLLQLLSGNSMMRYWGFQCPSAAKDLPLLESLSGAHVSMSGMYMSAWSNGKYVPFPKAAMDAMYAYGAEPQLTWQFRDSSADPKSSPNWSYATILAGTHNAYITQFAQAMALCLYPIKLRIFHEQQGDWYPWGYLNGNNGNTPALHKQAWEYVVNLIRQSGAKNIKMMWCPSAYDSTLDIALPNISTIDIASVDSYNFGSFGPHGWRTASQMFNNTMNWYAKVAPNTPIIIGEVGCAEDPTNGDKGAWITDMFTTFANYPQLVGFMWMHDTASGGRINRLDSSPGASAAFKQQVAQLSKWAPGCVSVQDRYVPLIVV